MLLRFVNNDFIYSFLLSLFISGGRGERQVSICDNLRLRNKHTIGREGTNVDSCQREWMVLIEKTPGCVTDTHTHTHAQPSDSLDCSKRGCRSVCARLCVVRVSLPNMHPVSDYLPDIYFFFHRHNLGSSLSSTSLTGWDGRVVVRHPSICLAPLSVKHQVRGSWPPSKNYINSLFPVVTSSCCAKKRNCWKVMGCCTAPALLNLQSPNQSKE